MFFGIADPKWHIHSLSLQSDAGQNITANLTESNSGGGELTPAVGTAVVGIGQGSDHAAVTAQAIVTPTALQTSSVKAILLLLNRTFLHPEEL
jgi:hypothetical protein